MLVTSLYWTLLLDNACALLSHHHRIEQLFWPIASPVGLSDFCTIVLTLMSTVAQSHTAPLHFGGWWRWALVSSDGVAPSRMVGVSASVNLPLHHKVQKFSSGTDSPGWSRNKGRKTVVFVLLCILHIMLFYTLTLYYRLAVWHSGNEVLC